MMDDTDFLKSAAECMTRFKTNGEEFEIRNAMSRAYYGAYHRASDMLTTLNLPTVSTHLTGTHEQLASRYQKSSTSTLKQAGIALAAAHKLRCLADYQLKSPLTSSIASQQLSKCEGICKRLEQVKAAISRAS